MTRAAVCAKLQKIGYKLTDTSLTPGHPIQILWPVKGGGRARLDYHGVFRDRSNKYVGHLVDPLPGWSRAMKALQVLTQTMPPE